ncbi:MAG: polysaccharide lyase family 8 super-sandwich domain-containing protein [Chitinophagales bacterium]
MKKITDNITCLVVFLFAFLFAAAGKADTDIEIIRKRVIDDLLAPGVQVNEVKRLISTIQPDGSWPGINYKDVSRTGFQHSRHLENMLMLARAYKKAGTEYYGNGEVKKTVSSALDFWIDHDFICDNWWWNEMGTPNLMINILLVMDNDLTEKQKKEGARIANRANLQASGARPGGDLIQIDGMLGKQALFLRNEDTLKRVIDVMITEIRIANGRGLQPDMSFHHRIDNVISTLTYGTGYANAFAYWAVKIAGTKFTFPDEAMKLLVDYYLDGICQSMAFGTYPDPGAMNRDISRKGALGPSGPGLGENLRKATSYRSEELDAIIKSRKGEKRLATSKDRIYWHSEYFTQQRPGYFASVRMFSSRQSNMEQPHNEEGIKNHHYSDGSNFVTRTGKEWFDIFPVWDWMKIPGTTITQKPAIPHWNQLAKKGLRDFVGGVTDGKYGAAAMDLRCVHDSLKACKSWFFFDNEYVCLGTDINTTEDFPVATTLNQCLLNKQVVVKSKGRSANLDKGEHKLENVSWVYHDSVAYLFPLPVAVNLNNTTATGNWRQINHQAWATEETVQKETFTLWIDHGNKPQNAGYEYIVVPGIAVSSVDNYKKKNEISILSNTAELQAVKHNGLHISYIVFYKPGTIEIEKNMRLTAENPCIVMIKSNGSRIEKIVVSDPTQKLVSLQLNTTARFESSGMNWKSIWEKEKNTSVIHVDLPKEGNAGKSVIIE